MCISISIDNYCEVVEKELSSKFSPEEIKRMNDWYSAKDQDTAFREYQDNIRTVECKYCIDLANANFYELWSLLNLEPEDSGEVSGYELIELKIKAESLLNTIKSIPEQFTTETEEIKEEGKATVIVIGKDNEYWERTINDLINLIDKTDRIFWG
jgi:hypothetical protein